MHTSLRKLTTDAPALLPALPARSRSGGGGEALFQISLQFDIRSTLRLWHAAAERLRECGLSMLDIETTIGDVTDPSIADCLATLILPRHAPGCDLVDVRIGPGRAIDDLFELPALSEH